MTRHTSHEPTPAIVRTLSEKDEPIRTPADKIISQPYDSVSHSRGLGDSGYRVQVVNHECPRCGFDRMVRRVDINPELPSEVRYWCLNPNCVHYASDHLSHTCHGNYPQMDVSEPEIFGEIKDV